VLRAVKPLHHCLSCVVALLVDERLELPHIGLLRFGQCGAELRQILQGHVEVAHRTETPSEPSQLDEVRLDGRLPEIVAEQLLRRARPADRYPHFVHVFGVLTDACAELLQDHLHELALPNQTTGLCHVHGRLDVRV